tara:strand:- start:617 stop:832 length:216 start_codon:yes stop_codon:yes gene_type:complete
LSTKSRVFNDVENKIMTNKQEKMIKEHKKRMYDMRFFSLQWQEIHQKRWGENSKCGDDTCDCEEIYYGKKE